MVKIERLLALWLCVDIKQITTKPEDKTLWHSGFPVHRYYSHMYYCDLSLPGIMMDALGIFYIMKHNGKIFLRTEVVCQSIEKIILTLEPFNNKQAALRLGAAQGVASCVSK